MKIVFWGSSDFSMPSVEKLAEHFEIAGVVTNEDTSCGRGMKEARMTPVKLFALERKIPVLQPCDLNDDNFQKELFHLGPQLFVVVSYGNIIPEKIINQPQYQSINLHASLLPKYRGASPIQTALVSGENFTGVSVQHMAKEMDKGDVILQKEIGIDPEDNYVTLSSRLAREGAELLTEAVDQIRAGKSIRKPQNEEDASYSKRIRKEDGKISFIDNTAEEIYNKWRGYYSWPGIFTFYYNQENQPREENKDRIVFLTEIRIHKDVSDAIPGTVVRANKKGLTVSCRQNFIEILKIKPAGKKEIDAVSFVNGYRPTEGRFF